MHHNMGYAYAEAGERGGPWRRRGQNSGLFRHPAELALMILGFVLFWPVGLAALFYFLWRKKMGCNWKGQAWRPDRAFREQAFDMFKGGPFGGSGNAAFDDYRTAVLKRLEDERRKLDEEQMAFRAFVERLRRAKDQDEFDRFMADRNGSAPRSEPPQGEAPQP
jgi:hypothetical protein